MQAEIAVVERGVRVLAFAMKKLLRLAYSFGNAQVAREARSAGDV